MNGKHEKGRGNNHDLTTGVRRSFLGQLVRDRPTRKRSPGIAGQLANLGIGRRELGDSSFIHYDERDYEAAEAMLCQAVPEEGGAARVHISPRPPQAREPKPKPLRPRVHAAEAAPRAAPVATRTPAVVHAPGLVCLTRLGGSASLPAGTRMLGMPWTAAKDLPHEVLVVCERLDVFLRIADLRWMEAYLVGRDALCVFRGGDSVFGGEAATSLIAASTAPVLALVDLHPRSLAAAGRLPRFENLCFPPWPELKSLVDARQSVDAFRRAVAVHTPMLDAVTHPAIAAAWRRVRRFGDGIKSSEFPCGAAPRD